MPSEEAAADHLRTAHPEQWLPGSTVERVEVDAHGEPLVAIRPGPFDIVAPPPNRAARRRAGNRGDHRARPGWRGAPLFIPRAVDKGRR